MNLLIKTSFFGICVAMASVASAREDFVQGVAVARAPAPAAVEVAAKAPAAQTSGALKATPRVASANVKPAVKKSSGSTISGYMTPTVYNKPFYNLDEPDERFAKVCTPRNSNKTFVDPKGKVLLSRVCEKVYENCTMQGTCTILKDEQIYRIKYAATQKMSNGKVKYVFVIDNSACDFGFGSARVCLIPYKSIAVDPSKLKYNSVVYVPSLKKIDESGKMIHDGCFVAHDTGGNIKGYGRFDFFIGDDDYKEPDNEYITHFIKNNIHGKKKIPFVNLSAQKAKEVCSLTNFDFKKPY